MAPFEDGEKASGPLAGVARSEPLPASLALASSACQAQPLATLVPAPRFCLRLLPLHTLCACCVQCVAAGLEGKGAPGGAPRQVHVPSIRARDGARGPELRRAGRAASKSELSVAAQGLFVSPLVPAGCPWLREHLQRLWSTCCVPGSVTPTAGQPRGPGDRQRRFPKVARSRSRPAPEPLARSPLAAGFPPSVSAAPYTCVTGRGKGPGVCAPIFL